MRLEPQLRTRPHSGGRRNSGPSAPNVPTVDQVLFLLMAHPHQWFVVVDPMPGQWSALGIALHRRGCEVTRLLGVVRVRWTHGVPTADSLVRVVRPLAVKL